MSEVTCRICGDGSSDAFPLYHPCKCAGSIRYIHEDCLIKWISVKESTNKGRRDVSSGTASGLSCEICGHRFEFAPVLSPEYKGDSLWTSVLVFFEVIREIIYNSLCWSLPFIKLFSSCGLLPLMAGLVAVSASSSFSTYQFDLPFVTDHLGQIFFAGSISLAISLFPIGGVGLTWCLVSSPIVGTVGWILSVFIGRAVVGRSISPDPLFSVLDEDLIFSCYGLVAVGVVVGVVWAVLNRSIVFGPMASSVVTTIYRTMCMLVTPLAVGVSVSSGLDMLWDGEPAYLPTAMIYLGIGSLVLAPMYLFNNMFWKHLISKPVRKNIKRNSPILAGLLGNKRFRDTGIDMLMELVTVVVFGQFLGWDVVGTILKKFNFCPCMNFFDFATSQISVPLELFYAHVLVPLVLTAPPVPACIGVGWKKCAKKIHFADDTAETMSVGKFLRILILRQIVFNLVISVMVGVPSVVGRLLLGRNDIIAFAIGALAALALIHVAFRTIHAFEKMHVFNLRWILQIVGRSMYVGVVALVICPVQVGYMFQYAVIVPLKELHDPSTIKISLVGGAPDSVLIQLIPVWINGLMMLKVGIAILALGGAEVRNVILRYNEHGLFDEDLQRKILLFAKQIIIKSVFHGLLPVMLAIGLEKYSIISLWARKHLLAGYLVSYILVRHICPMIGAWLQTQKKVAFEKKFILKQQLKNLEFNCDDDSVIM